MLDLHYTSRRIFPGIPRNPRNEKEVRNGCRFVYVIQAGHSGPVKIGCARDPFERLESLQTGSFLELRLIAYEDICDWRAARLVEAELHKTFRKYLIRGEWFDVGPELERALVHFEFGVSLIEFTRFADTPAEET